jgi:hypothetical protein
MSLRASLRSVTAWSARAASWAAPELPTETERARLIVEAQAAGLSASDVPPFDIGGLKRRLMRAADNGTLGRVVNSDWRYCPWALWHENDQLAGRSGVLAEYFSRVAARHSTSWLKSLIGAYLARFFPESPSTQAVATQILKLLRSGRWPTLGVWLERHQTLGMFDPKSGPGRTGQAMLSADSVADGLKLMGLESAVDQTADHRFLAAAYAEGLLATRPLLRPKAHKTSQIVDRIVEWSTPENRAQNGVRYPSVVPQLAGTLLLPWREANPPAAVEESIKKFLIARIGDPRTRAGAWHKVDPAAVAVLRRWLAGDTLAQFFDLLSRTADETWEYRKKFWTAYYEIGAISEAWFALGPEARYYADRMARGTPRLAYAELAGAARNQSVLIMKLGGFLVAEWSHSGKCRLWSETDPRASKMYASKYAADELRVAADHEQIHYSSATGRWQREIAGFVRKRTRISVDSSAWTL